MGVKKERIMLEHAKRWWEKELIEASLSKYDCTVLGLDLSYTSTGYVVLENGELRRHGTFGTDADFGTVLERNQEMLKRFRNLISTYRPDIIGMESINVYSNPKSSQLLIYTEAMLYQAIMDHDYRPPMIRFVNSQIKKIASGEGGGSKSVVLKDVLANYGANLDSDDEADAYCAAVGAYSMVEFVEWYNEMYHQYAICGGMDDQKFVQQMHLGKWVDECNLFKGVTEVLLSTLSAESGDCLSINSREAYKEAKQAAKAGG